MSQIITVEVRSVYGRDTIYPADAAARAFAAIAGTTTLTVPVLKQIIGLGYEVRVGRSAAVGRIENGLFVAYKTDDVFGPGGVMDRLIERDRVPS